MAPNRKRKQRTRLDGALRRERILDEAMLLIGARGYHGFSIQELARRCRLTNAGLLYYFGTKEQLLIALLEDRQARYAATVSSATGFRREDIDRLALADIRRLFHTLLVNSATQPDVVRLFDVLSSEALDPSHPAHDYFVERENRILEDFSRMLSPHVAQPLSTARQLITLMRGLEMQWLRSHQEFDLVAEWDRAAALVLPSAAPARRRRLARQPRARRGASA